MTGASNRRVALIFRSGAMISLTADQNVTTNLGPVTAKELPRLWLADSSAEWVVVPQEMEVLSSADKPNVPGVSAEPDEAAGRSLTRLDRIDMIWVEGSDDGEELFDA